MQVPLSYEDKNKRKHAKKQERRLAHRQEENFIERIVTGIQNEP